MGKKGGTDDPRGALIFSYYKALSLLRPRCFLFENVPNFASINSGQVAKDLIQKFSDLGYSLWSGVLCAADYGAYTFRRRFFIIGVMGSDSVALPRPSHFESFDGCEIDAEASPWRRCGEVFENVEAWLSEGKPLSNNEGVMHTQKVVDRFSTLKFGETDNIRKRNRLHPERPAHSIYVGGVTGKLQARTHIHPYHPRELTPRECAAIQGFPLDWKFSGRTDAVMLQAANAVPVQLAESLARHLVSMLRQQRRNEVLSA
jgi:DNA (cytosine-5)-methyltransferase 1